jgi:hypothetical protein
VYVPQEEGTLRRVEQGKQEDEEEEAGRGRRRTF